MRLTLRILASFLLCAVSALSTSCGATGKFKYTGEPPDWDTELPAPEADYAVPGTMRIRLHCATMEDDDEFVEALSQSVRAQFQNAGMGDVRRYTPKDGPRPQYEIVVYEAGEDGKFDFNEEAGIWSGIGTGVAVGVLTEDLGAGIGAGAGGAVLGGLIFGEKKEIYMFAGVARQYTSASATKSAEDNSSRSGSQGGGITDRDSGDGASADSARRSLESAQWNYQTHARERPFAFKITVEGGSMSSKDTRDAAARDAFLKRFPKFVTGGTVL
ncbi:MAG: hypothetical protein AB7O97_15015 [Planctomycetota bacterium]